MINNINVSNLQVFNKEGTSLPCPNDLQEAIQVGIAKKVGKLLNAEGFLTLIPGFDPSKGTKLRIYLTKDGITIQLLERDLEVDTSYTKKDPELSEEIKIRKEKIIKKIDSLFKEPSFLNPSARLASEKTRPLFIPLQSSKNEQVPFKIGFDTTTVSNSKIESLHAKIEGLQDQLNKPSPHSKELEVIKEQLQFLNRAIHNLSIKQENITYPHTEEYALINKLVDNQRDVYRALLDLLSSNLSQIPTPPSSVFQDTKIKEMTFKAKENASLEEIKDLSAQEQKELIDLKEDLKNLSNLQKEKDNLELEYENLKQQFNISKEIQYHMSASYDKQMEQLAISNRTLQTQLSTKDEEIFKLEDQFQSLTCILEELKEEHFLLQKKLETLKQSYALTDKNHDKTSHLLANKEEEIAALQEKIKELHPLTLKLFNLQKEKDDLKLEHRNLTKQLELTNQNQTKLSTNFENKIKKLENLTKDLQIQLFIKDKEFFGLNEQFQHLFETHQALQNQLENEKEISSILETAAIPEASKEIAFIDTIIKEAEKPIEENLSYLENSTITEGPLTPTSDYYTLTMPSLEERLEISSETTILQAKINDLQEELKDIRPIAYNTTNIIEKMEKSNKDLTLELSEKTKTIENLEEEKKFLESQLDRSESQVKELKTAQYQLEKQQKEISISSEDSNALLEELEKSQKQLSSEKKERAKLEQIHEEQLERLKTLYNENTLEKMERINAKIINLQQEQKITCLTLTHSIANYMKSESITEDIGHNIFNLIEKAFNATGYKTLLDLVSSEEDLASSEGSISSGEYVEDSYIEL